MNKRGPGGIWLLGLLAASTWSAARCANFTIERVSLAPGGAQIATTSSSPSVSANGRYVTFSTSASNLVVGDTNNQYDIFVRDRTTGVIERASVTASGGNANLGSGETSIISADGQFVFFNSPSSNLVPNDTNGTYDVFVRNRWLGATERVSVAMDGGSPNGSCGYTPAASADGRYVAFTSNATNLVPNDTNGRHDLFVRDRELGITERVSVADNEAQANDGREQTPTISGDGRYVAFASDATNLVPNDTNACSDIFLRDRVAGTTRRLSVSTWGEEANGPSEAPTLSANGRYVSFITRATNFVAGDVNDKLNFFVHDCWTNTTELVDVTLFGHVGNGDAEDKAAFSADGRYLTFASASSGLVEGDNAFVDVFVRDLVLGVTVRVSQALDGSGGNDRSRAPSISPEGDVVVFMSQASNLVAGDTNGWADVFATSNPLYNAPPQAQPDKTLTLLEDATGTSLGITAPTDDENDPLTITVDSLPTAALGSVRRSAGPAVTLGQTLTSAELTTLVFDPVANAHGSAGGFAYTVADDHGGLATQNVTLEITPVNDLPLANGQSLTLAEDTATPITLSGSDVDGDPLTYSLVTPPTHGALTGTGAARTYTPAANYSGPDAFTFQLYDGAAFSATATVQLSITALNDTPVAHAGANRTVEATGPLTPVTLNGAATTDADGDTLTYRWTRNGMEVGATPSPTVHLPLGQHVLSLTVTDPSGADSSDDVVITVQDTTAPLLTLPANRSVAQTTVSGAPVNFTATATDLLSEPIVTTNPASGSVFPVGQTTVQVTATDAAGNQATGTFQVTVTAPVSTAGKVAAKGALLVGGKNAKFNLTAQQVTGRPLKGKLTFTDPVLKQALKSTRLTALVLSGTKAQVFGEGQLPKRVTVRFLVEVEDLGTTPRSDRFRLELSNGRVYGPAHLNSGTVKITP